MKCEMVFVYRREVFMLYWGKYFFFVIKVVLFSFINRVVLEFILFFIIGEFFL